MTFFSIKFRQTHITSKQQNQKHCFPWKEKEKHRNSKYILNFILGITSFFKTLYAYFHVNATQGNTLLKLEAKYK